MATIIINRTSEYNNRLRDYRILFVVAGSSWQSTCVQAETRVAVNNFVAVHFSAAVGVLPENPFINVSFEAIILIGSHAVIHVTKNRLDINNPW